MGDDSGGKEEDKQKNKLNSEMKSVKTRSFSLGSIPKSEINIGSVNKKSINKPIKTFSDKKGIVDKGKGDLQGMSDKEGNQITDDPFKSKNAAIRTPPAAQIMKNILDTQDYENTGKRLRSNTTPDAEKRTKRPKAKQTTSLVPRFTFHFQRISSFQSSFIPG